MGWHLNGLTELFDYWHKCSTVSFLSQHLVFYGPIFNALGLRTLKMVRFRFYILLPQTWMFRLRLRFVLILSDSVLCLLTQLASLERCTDAMASHSSSPVPHPSSGGSEGIFRKDRDPSSRQYRPVHSLPDVCPKEPTGKELAYSWPAVLQDEYI